jgi:DNA-binding NarL/FixJ family response regulator
MTTVALVDDHITTRTGIRSLIELSQECKVILEASNGAEFLGALRRTALLPDIVILDLTMPVMNGVETIDALRTGYPEMSILVFSLLCEEDTVMNAISRGACGFVSKSADPLTICKAIKDISEQGSYLGDLVKNDYFRRRTLVKDRNGFYGKQILTARELEFIRLGASDLTYTEIAGLMSVRPKTLENYRDSVFLKLGIHNRAALAVYAYKHGLI